MSQPATRRSAESGTVPAIQVRDLSASYALGKEKPHIVARDVSLSVERGEFVSVVGPSGCGKTTLLNVIAGFLPPASGEVLLNGLPVRRPSPECTVVFQSYALFPWMTVAENVEFGLKMQGVGRSSRERVASQYLDLMGLTGNDSKYPHQVSGGMQQRVALARALAIEPSVVLMDEPLAAVDLQTREILQDEIARVVNETSQTILLVTHSVDEAVYLSDRVILMGGKPGSISATREVELPKPREHWMKSSEDFLRLRDEVAELLRTAHAAPDSSPE